MKLSKETLKQIIKEELEAAMDEGYAAKTKGYRYGHQPRHPSDKREAPDFSTPEMQMKMTVSAILRDDAGLRISQSGGAAKEIVNNLQDEGFDLTDYLINTIGIPSDQAPDMAEKIMKEINQ